MDWILIVYIFSAAQPFTEDVPVSARVPGFATESECRQRGERAKSLADGGRSFHYLCKQRKSTN